MMLPLLRLSERGITRTADAHRASLSEELIYRATIFQKIELCDIT